MSYHYYFDVSSPAPPPPRPPRGSNAAGVGCGDICDVHGNPSCDSNHDNHSSPCPFPPSLSPSSSCSSSSFRGGGQETAKQKFRPLPKTHFAALKQQLRRAAAARRMAFIVLSAESAVGEHQGPPMRNASGVASDGQHNALCQRPQGSPARAQGSAHTVCTAQHSMEKLAKNGLRTNEARELRIGMPYGTLSQLPRSTGSYSHPPRSSELSTWLRANCMCSGLFRVTVATNFDSNHHCVEKVSTGIAQNTCKPETSSRKASQTTRTHGMKSSARPH